MDEHAARLGKEAAEVYRQYIDSIDTDIGRIQDTISFHEYEIKRLTAIIASSIHAAAKEKAEIQKDTHKPKKTAETEKTKYMGSLFKKLISKYGAGLEFNNDEEKDKKTNEIVADILKEEYDKEYDRQEIIDYLLEAAGKMILYLTEAQIKKIKKSNTAVLQVSNT